MKLRWLAVAILAAGPWLGCSNAKESPQPGPGLETLRAGLQEHDELERTYLLTSYFRTLGPEDVQTVLEEVEKFRTGIDADEVRLLMLAWTRFDGPGAFATARDWPTPWSSVLMEEAMHAWGYHDGRAALAECEKIEDEELRNTLRASLVSGWVSGHDPLGASEYGATISDSRRRTRFAFRLAGNLKRDGAEAVIAWADAVPEDAPNGFKATVFSHAAGVVTRLDPERAASWFESRMKHSYTSASLRVIAGKWARHNDRKTLLVWIQSLPLEEAREPERTSAIQSIFRIWAADSLDEAEAALASIPAGPGRDVAIDEFARAKAKTSPAQALRWTAQIEDEELRRKRTIRFSRLLFALDSAAGQSWLEGADIPPEWRQQVLENLPRARRAGNAQNSEPEG